jgi:hypothetical protein
MLKEKDDRVHVNNKKLLYDVNSKKFWDDVNSKRLLGKGQR